MKSDLNKCDNVIVAKLRWKLLANVLCSRNAPAPNGISKRNFDSFRLFQVSKRENLQEYALESNGRVCRIVFTCDNALPTVTELIDTCDNTGNICVWPSEEVLAYYALEHIDKFENKRVLELGGGLSCLAGLLIAKYGHTKVTHLTDGNLRAITNVQQSLALNDLTRANVQCFQLKWNDSPPIPQYYDVIVCADCVYFDDARQDLIEMMWNSLSDDGIVYVLAPRRGNTLNEFIILANLRGFSCMKTLVYDRCVWRRHSTLFDTDSSYTEDIHYPLLVKLRKMLGVLND